MEDKDEEGRGVPDNDLENGEVVSQAREDEPVSPLPGRLPPLAISVLTTIVATVAIALTVRPAVAGSWTLWLGLGVPYLLLGSYAVYLMYDDGTLLERLTPRGGDFTLGVLVAAGLLFGSWSLRASIAPAGSEWQGWVARIYLMLGDPSVIQRSAEITIALLAVAALQELTWRGMVQDALEEVLGTRRGWIVTAGLYTAVSIPTVFSLSDTVAGLNPLMVFATLGCAVVWGFMTRLVRRLWPAMFSHMAFLYFTAVQFHIPGLTPAPL